MSQRILLLGGTGLLGEPVARALARAGFCVRLMSRDTSAARRKFPPPFEVIGGDALKPSDIEDALADCYAVHISIYNDREDECVTRVVDAARRFAIRRITYVSGTTVCEENRWFPLVDRKMHAEQSIIDSGIGYTTFRPGWFMEVLGRFVRNGRAMVFGRPSKRWHLVSCEDFARMVTQCYERDDVLGRTLYVHGPQALTMVEALTAYCRVLHPEISNIHHIPYWLLRLIATCSRDSELRVGLNMIEYLERVGERGDPAEANALLGAPETTLDAWLQRQITPLARAQTN